MADLEAQMALFQAELQAVEHPQQQQMPLMPPSHGPPGSSAPQSMQNQPRQVNTEYEHHQQHQQHPQQQQQTPTFAGPNYSGPMPGQNGPQMPEQYNPIMMGAQQMGPMMQQQQQQYPHAYQQQPQQQMYDDLQQMMGNNSGNGMQMRQPQQGMYQMGQGGLNMSSMRPNLMQMSNSMMAPPPDMLSGHAQHNGMGSSSMGSGGYQGNTGMQQQRQGMAGPNRGMMSSGPQGPGLGSSVPAGTDEPAKGKDGKEKLLHKGPVRAAAGERWRDPTLDEWPENDFRVFVGDLGNEVNDEHLSKAFGKYASFAKAKIVRDKKTKKSKGFGFVSFTDGLDFAKAMREMQGKYIGNRPCKLTKSSWDERNAPPKRKGEGQHSGNTSKRQR